MSRGTKDMGLSDTTLMRKQPLPFIQMANGRIIRGKPLKVRQTLGGDQFNLTVGFIYF